MVGKRARGIEGKWKIKLENETLAHARLVPLLGSLTQGCRRKVCLMGSSSTFFELIGPFSQNQSDYFPITKPCVDLFFCFKASCNQSCFISLFLNDFDDGLKEPCFLGPIVPRKTKIQIH